MKHWLQRLLSRVNHAVDRQVVGALEGTGTELTDVIPLVYKSQTCMLYSEQPQDITVNADQSG